MISLLYLFNYEFDIHIDIMSLLVIHPLHKLLSMCNKLMEIMTRLITFHFFIIPFGKVALGNRNYFPCEILNYDGKKNFFSFIDCF